MCACDGWSTKSRVFWYLKKVRKRVHFLGGGLWPFSGMKESGNLALFPWWMQTDLFVFVVCLSLSRRGFTSALVDLPITQWFLQDQWFNTIFCQWIYQLFILYQCCITSDLFYISVILPVLVYTIFYNSEYLQDQRLYFEFCIF